MHGQTLTSGTRLDDLPWRGTGRVLGCMGVASLAVVTGPWGMVAGAAVATVYGSYRAWRATDPHETLFFGGVSQGAGAMGGVALVAGLRDAWTADRQATPPPLPLPFEA